MYNILKWVWTLTERQSDGLILAVCALCLALYALYIQWATRKEQRKEHYNDLLRTRLGG